MSRRKDGSFVPRECKLVSVAMEWINFHERTIAIQSELVHDSLEGWVHCTRGLAEKSVRMASVTERTRQAA